MIGKIFLLTACCCASLLSVSASEESQDSSSTTLHYEMKQVANYIKFLTNDDNRNYLEEKFRNASMPGDGSLKALSAFVENLDVLREEVPFENSLFDETLIKDLEIQDPDDVFKSLLERVPLIKAKLSAFNAYLNDNPPRMLGSGKEKMNEYYKKHICKEDVKEKDYESLVKFCSDFLDGESPFMNMYKALNEYDELVKGKPAKPSSPTNSSSQGTTSTEQSRGPAVPGKPQPIASATEPAQESAAPNTSAGNLNGKQAGSSFTYGGLTVATLCYFVLSAF
uniref:Merozoite surface antigen-2b n=1 Tax=Babesia bovis TaxID=5865 RepID=A0A0D6A037_BABBO|nr:merozoite surface antigen-2b [Babesia bovis]